MVLVVVYIVISSSKSSLRIDRELLYARSQYPGDEDVLLLYTATYGSSHKPSNPPLDQCGRLPDLGDLDLINLIVRFG